MRFRMIVHLDRYDIFPCVGKQLQLRLDVSKIPEAIGLIEIDLGTRYAVQEEIPNETFFMKPLVDILRSRFHELLPKGVILLL